MKKYKFLLTGVAGFIGFHVTRRLLTDGHTVVGLDNLNDYYDVRLKMDRLEQLRGLPNFSFIKMDLTDRNAVTNLFLNQDFERVIHLGAQVGVRHSLQSPMTYADSNVIGTLTILEGCRHSKIDHLIYASSSSVYGMNTKLPFSTADRVDHPLSLYAATKKANELMAHTYSHLYGIPTTGLRFFTVYGPWGRPDMAPILFAKAISNNQPIKVFNNGNMRRDFTYIDDLVEGIIRVQDKPPTPDPNWDGKDPSRSTAPYKIYNMGSNQPVQLMSFINTIERFMGKEAIKEFYPMQSGDLVQTYADMDDITSIIDLRPSYSIEVGVQRLIEWYKTYYEL